MVSGVSPKRGLRILWNPVVLKALATRAPLARRATVSAPEVVHPTARSNSAVIGLVQSIIVLPAKLLLLSRPSTASHGTASTTTSLWAIASATDTTLRPPPASFSGERTPYITVCPLALHPMPNALPTLPLPKTAIFIIHHP